jgi:hypothetical protein
MKISVSDRVGKGTLQRRAAKSEPQEHTPVAWLQVPLTHASDQFATSVNSPIVGGNEHESASWKNSVVKYVITDPS